MEYILINDSKLKIILEERELEEWDISIDELDYSNPAAKRVFEGLLGYAKQELGFDTSGYKVLIQLYPSKDGGCELFVTRLGESSERQSKSSRSRKEKKQAEQRAYSFDKLSHLLAVCKRLCLSGFTGESSAWFDKEGKWFLLMSLEGDSDSSKLLPPDRFSFITEYGEYENPKALSLYLGEYAKAVCENDAALILGKI